MTTIIRETTAYLAFGGNVGDVREAFDHAMKRLEKASGHPVRSSQLYRTAPWGETDQPEFLNMAVEIEWESQPEKLLELALDIERDRGRDRDREKRWGPRTLDIDLLLVGSRIITSEKLTLPHPRMRERTFVLAPLRDLAPDLVPPGWEKTVLQTLEQRPDREAAVPLESPSL